MGSFSWCSLDRESFETDLQASGRTPASTAIRTERCPMRRLTAIIIPVCLAFSTVAVAAASNDSERGFTTDESNATVVVRTTTPPDPRRESGLSLEQRRAIAENLDRMHPRMRRAVLSRLARTTVEREEIHRVGRSGPDTRRGDSNRIEREDRRSRRLDRVRSRPSVETARRGTRPFADEPRSLGRANDRRDVGAERLRVERRRPEAARNVKKRDRRPAAGRAEDDHRRLRSSDRARGDRRISNATPGPGKAAPRLRRAAPPSPEASAGKRFSRSERRRRD